MDAVIKFLAPIFVLSLAIQTFQEWLDVILDWLAEKWPGFGRIQKTKLDDATIGSLSLNDLVSNKKDLVELLSDDLKTKFEEWKKEKKDDENAKTLLKDIKKHLKNEAKQQKGARKRAISYVISFVIALSISFALKLQLLSGLATTVGDTAVFGIAVTDIHPFWDSFIGAVIIAGGTETTNSIVKFLGYKKDEAKPENNGDDTGSQEPK